jgi:hypothetical protein
MTRSYLYYAGLILTILGLIGTISEAGPVWTRYFIFGLGLAILLVSYIIRRRN